MPFNHNHHYHPLLLEHLPPGPGLALDVGCGQGRFARRLAATGMAVEGVDVSARMIDAATGLGSPGPGKIVYRQADIATEDLPERHYDFISCIASLHHMPFATLTKLRRALVPGGVLVVLGLARPSTPADWVKAVSATPVNLLARLVIYTGDRLNGGEDPLPKAPVRDDYPSMAQVRRETERLLPGRKVRTLLLWRYLVTYREPEDAHPIAG